MKINKKFDREVIVEGNRLLVISCRKAIERSRCSEGAYQNVKCSFKTAKQLYSSIRLNNKKLYEEWMRKTVIYLEAESRADRYRLRPTLDRIDSNGHYFINNLQVLTFGENASKAQMRK
ncbi:hypothetical protein [Bacillus sp. Marseille-Q1617]|uniref:hypothetical protein n=1 Tax=Bacillus sp. Marseille-Q1617 TaxID=2736887 RepID=UPI00158CF2C4|nr:hypothetical protein [Bacillus sp. Marseille-Q1617]